MISIDTQIACVKRELGMRQRVYPRAVLADRMTPFESDAEIAAMQAVLKTLEEVKHIQEPELKF